MLHWLPLFFMKKLQILTAGLLLASLTPLAAFAATGTETAVPTTTAPTTLAAPTTATATTAAPTGAAASDALNVPGAPRLVSKTADSVTLEWDKVAPAKAYIVKYSKTSVAQAFKEGKTNAVYDMESDQVTATGTTIKDLKADTPYYFAVVAVDAANNESTTNSEELAVTLSATDGTSASGATAATNFKLSAVTVVNDMTLHVDFSSPLSPTTPVSVKLTKTVDTSSVVVQSIATDSANASRAVVILSTPLDPSSSYSLVVIQAKDTSGASISQGVNAIKEFTTTANLVKMATAATASGTTGSGAEVALNAAPTEGSGALATNGTLPATGTQETLLLVLAALVALAIVSFVRSRKA